MYQDHFYEVEPGVKLHYYDEGAGQAIVFVPGWAFAADVFEKQIAAFCGQYRCIVVDPRSQGKSTVTYSGNNYRQQGADLGKLIDKLGLEHVVLVGWSFGALTCWEYARQYGTAKIAASITLDNSPRSISDDETEYRAGTLADLCGAHQDSLCSQPALHTFMESFCDGLLYENKMDPALRQKLIDTACQIPACVADALYVDGWLADERDIVKQLEATVPTLLIIANYRKEAGVPHVQKYYPNTEVHAFGMHMMFHEYAEKLNDIMLRFLEKKVK